MKEPTYDVLDTDRYLCDEYRRVIRLYPRLVDALRCVVTATEQTTKTDPDLHVPFNLGMALIGCREVLAECEKGNPSE